MVRGASRSCWPFPYPPKIYRAASRLGGEGGGDIRQRKQLLAGGHNLHGRGHTQTYTDGVGTQHGGATGASGTRRALRKSAYDA